MKRITRGLACAGIAVLGIWYARYFARRAVQPPAEERGLRSEGPVARPPATAPAWASPATRGSVLDATLRELSATAPPAGVSLPEDTRALWTDASSELETVSVWRSRRPPEAWGEQMRRHMAADGWRAAGPLTSAPAGAWLGRYVRGDRECLIHAAIDGKSGETVIVLRIMAAR